MLHTLILSRSSQYIQFYSVIGSRCRFFKLFFSLILFTTWHSFIWCVFPSRWTRCHWITFYNFLHYYTRTRLASTRLVFRFFEIFQDFSQSFPFFSSSHFQLFTWKYNQTLIRSKSATAGGWCWMLVFESKGEFESGESMYSSRLSKVSSSSYPLSTCSHSHLLSFSISMKTNF